MKIFNNSIFVLMISMGSFCFASNSDSLEFKYFTARNSSIIPCGNEFCVMITQRSDDFRTYQNLWMSFPSREHAIVGKNTLARWQRERKKIAIIPGAIHNEVFVSFDMARFTSDQGGITQISRSELDRRSQNLAESRCEARLRNERSTVTNIINDLFIDDETCDSATVETIEVANVGRDDTPDISARRSVRRVIRRRDRGVIVD